MDSTAARPTDTPLHTNPGAIAALLLTPLFFAINLVLARASVATISPWTLAFWRWVFAVADHSGGGEG
jgi:hypothetical protein